MNTRSSGSWGRSWANGGHVSIHSEPVVGTTFKFSLPVSGKTEADPDAVGAPLELAGSPSGEDARLAIVDPAPEGVRGTLDRPETAAQA